VSSSTSSRGHNGRSFVERSEPRVDAYRDEACLAGGRLSSVQSRLSLLNIARVQFSSVAESDGAGDAIGIPVTTTLA
jgi:hypothetical protein